MANRVSWAIYDRSGRLLFLDLAEDEEAVWRVWLGWPDVTEIEAAKRRGERAVRVVVTEMADAR